MEIDTNEMAGSEESDNTISRRNVHDIRSPLTAVLGLASLIEMSTDLDKIHEWAKQIRRGAEQISDILDERSA